MTVEVVKESPAKLNLVLEILGRRDDGYHEIASLMQRISLFDEMTFKLVDEGIAIHCPESSLPEDEDNIVYRAAQMLLATGSYNVGVEIVIRKRIPLAAGLGGGSSNAATTLITLNEMIGSGFDTGDLMKMGAELGADVPFFVFGKTAWAFGIGERLQAAKNIPPMWFVLVNPGVELSTKVVYENVKIELTNGVIKYNIPRLQTVSQVVCGLRNDLERVSEEICPVISEIKERLMVHGALGSLMSGSGPTVFGIFEAEEDARIAENRLKQEHLGLVYRASSM